MGRIHKIEFSSYLPYKINKIASVCSWQAFKPSLNICGQGL